MADEEPQDPLDRLIADLELQIEMAPPEANMSALQVQLDGLKRHREAKLAEPPPEE